MTTKWVPCLSDDGIPVVFLRENLEEGPGLELCDVSQFSIFAEEILHTRHTKHIEGNDLYIQNGEIKIVMDDTIFKIN
jgi:hypothetical protein